MTKKLLSHENREIQKTSRFTDWMYRHYALAVVYSAAGMLAACAFNRFFPQISDQVEITEYPFGSRLISINEAYRAVLLGLAVYFVLSGLFSSKSEDSRFRFAGKAAFRFVCGIVLAVWDLLGTKLAYLPQPFFPGPSRIIEAFLSDGSAIWVNTLYSLRLYAAGFLLGIALGIGTGILIGWFFRARYWISPVLNISGVIPAVAWMPFALTLFPTAFRAAVFIIVISVWFPVASLTAAGIQSTPKVQFESARTMGANTFYLVFHVAVPHALPQIFTGIMTANSFAFTMLVIAEMMGQPGGLGYYINASKVWSAYYKVFAAILVMAILFSAIRALLTAIRNYCLRWQKGLVKTV